KQHATSAWAGIPAASPGQYLVAMTGPWRDLEQRLEFENEAERPLRESGEGESEGFEEAEAELIHQSEDPDLGRDPELDAIVEAEDAGSVYSEADEILSSEEPDSDHDG
ncbi:MAG TPA: hypothetical protein PKD47_08370, partial [Solirubrobacterales bacterium]|nr:hypothetical protein [Solirubrobacterales bacterium]